MFRVQPRKRGVDDSAEEKIQIVVSGLRGEDSIAELCRREGIAESLYYSWSKEFLEAGKKRLSGDTARQASSGEVKDLRREMHDLKEALAEQVLENRLLKKGELYRKVPKSLDPLSFHRQTTMCSAPGSLDTSLSHAAGLIEIAACHA